MSQLAARVGLLLLTSSLLGFGSGAAATTSTPPGFNTVLCCLDNPRGLALTRDGAIYVTEAGHGGAGPCATMRGVQMCYGATGAILRLKNHVVTRVAAGLPSYAPAGGSGSEGPTGICSDRAGRLFVTYGLGMDPKLRSMLGTGGVRSGYLMRITKTGAARAVVDISGYEGAHNPAGGPVDSNPYALLCERGDEVVTDAGGNSLFKVTKGKLSLLGVFPSRPGRSTDSVPTSVAVRHHAYYVGELTGKPFDIGVANIYRIVPGRPPQPYLSGFTAIIDLAFARNGSLYVLEHATGAGLSGPGALIKVSPSGTRTTISAALNHPTALALGRNGAIYVVDNGTDPGAGEIVRLVKTG
ncbi:MAG TPA: ScyD/ScyE family protein [Vicinamibacteria bacterium]